MKNRFIRLPVPYPAGEASQNANIVSKTLEIEGMDCPDCAVGIEKNVAQLRGVFRADVNFATGAMHVDYDDNLVSLNSIEQAVARHGAKTCSIPSEGMKPSDESASSIWFKNPRLAQAAISTMALLVGLGFQYFGISAGSGFWFGLSLMTGGWSIAKGAILSLKNHRMDMNALMFLAVLGACIAGDLREGAAIVALNSIGMLLESCAVDKTRNSLRELGKQTPKIARLLEQDSEKIVSPAEVDVGGIIRVLPGERIPLDGSLMSEYASVNESSITGESVPVDKKRGDQIYAGSLNGNAVLELETTRKWSDTTLSQLIHLVEKAQAQRAPMQVFIDRFAARYTPIVIGLAVLTAILPPLVLAHFALGHFPANWRFWFFRSLSLLIIACPCALVISTPVAIVTAIGAASKAGILIKGGVYLEAMAKVRTIAYDKTGTLTVGRFEVAETIPLDSFSPENILTLSSALESHTTHPLASAFKKDRVDQNIPNVVDFQEIPGRGVTGMIEGERWYLGNPEWIKCVHGSNIDLESSVKRMEEAGFARITLANSKRLVGVIGLTDTPSDTAAQTVSELRALGIHRQIMLTGDSNQVAQRLSNSLGLDGFKAELKPEEKLEIIRELQKESGNVCMVGDGVNDAPALAASHVGIATGAAASDTALETADIALLGNDLSRLSYLLRLCKRAEGILWQNVIFSVGSKLLLVSVAIGVGIPLWLAVVGDTGVSLLVTMNALRLSQS